MANCHAFLPAEQTGSGGLDLVVAGPKSGVMMVEAGANEVGEKAMIEAMEFAFKAMQPAIKLQEELVEKIGVTPAGIRA